MSRSYRSRLVFARALAASLALHLLAAPLFVASSLPSDRGPGAAEGAPNGPERISYTRVHRLVLEAHVRRPPATTFRTRTAAASRRPARIVSKKVPKPVATTAVATTVIASRPAAIPSPRAAAATDVPAGRAAYGEVAAASPGAAPPRGSHRALALTLATTAPERDQGTAPAARVAALPAVRQTPTAAATAPPTPQPPAASPTPALLAVRRGEVPPGGWGQTFERPLIADDSALEALRARFRGTHAIRIDVDEAGRATRVTVPGSLPTDVRAALERELLELRYVPAECNGLRCGSTLQLSL